MDTATPFGHLLRDWRQRRRLTQLDLADAAGVSTRHVSFLETHRSLPSRALLMRLGAVLDMPLRERNRMLVSAGFAPMYREHRWDGKGQRPVVPADYEHVASFINEANETLPGTDVGRHGEARVLVRREIDGEVFRAVFEILHGKRNRALKLISLAIKTAQK